MIMDHENRPHDPRQEHSAVPAVAEEVSRNEKREQMRLVPSANNRPVLRR